MLTESLQNRLVGGHSTFVTSGNIGLALGPNQSDSGTAFLCYSSTLIKPSVLGPPIRTRILHDRSREEEL